ncbi:hypothetical protein [Methylobacter sp. BlB1]|uniref:hypothetical protein n=1 Tax=Methylobacter sp. BlB1 TaxID=2785914 RepID=UPI0018951B84|nr:hypothetical protein [Methylobacter sp. BlB1]MBF6647175.1 hypothetical protein [Methylobacter sp. BlB1]
MNTQTDYQTKYFNHKAGINELKQTITDKQADIEGLKQRITETQTRIEQITKQLEIDEVRFSRPSKVIRPSMTLEEFKAQKSMVAEMRSELPVLREELDYKNKAMNVLKSDLSRKTDELHFVKGKIVEDLIEQSANALILAAGDQLEKLVIAIVAKNRSDNGFAIDISQKLNLEKVTSMDIGKTLFCRIFGDKGLPDLSEAQQRITAMIEGA